MNCGTWAAATIASLPLLELDLTLLEDLPLLELDFAEELLELELTFTELELDCTLLEAGFTELLDETLELDVTELLDATLELLGISSHTATTLISPDAVAGISFTSSEPYLQPKKS